MLASRHAKTSTCRHRVRLRTTGIIPGKSLHSANTEKTVPTRRKQTMVYVHNSPVFRFCIPGIFLHLLLLLEAVRRICRVYRPNPGFVFVLHHADCTAPTPRIMMMRATTSSIFTVKYRPHRLDSLQRFAYRLNPRSVSQLFLDIFL